jgi:hypothetical protein
MVKNMKVYSETTQRYYEDDDAIYYRNVIQSAWMLTHPDCELLDVFESGGKLVLAFSKESHKKYIKEWAERSLQNN